MMNHKEYSALSSSQKREILTSARQQQQYRKPIPIQGLYFSQQNWAPMIVQDVVSGWWSAQVTKIKLKTYREKSPLSPLKGVVLIFHGMTSHTNEGSYVGKELAKKGYEVVGFDQRGFGKSEGTRGYIRDFDTIMTDSEMFVQIVKEHYKGQKLFLLGLSLGGLTCYALALKHPKEFTGCVLMAPALRSYHGTGSYVAAKVLSFFLPNTQVPKVGRGGKRGSKNPNVSELRKDDKYRYQENPYIRTLSSSLDGIRAYEDTFEQFTSPVYVIQGAKDNSVDPQGSIDFYQRCSSKTKKINFYQNLWHNIWQEEEIYEIMPSVIEWYDSLLVGREKL